MLAVIKQFIPKQTILITPLVGSTNGVVRAEDSEVVQDFEFKSGFLESDLV